MACAIPTQTLTHIASRSVSGWQRQLPLSLGEKPPQRYKRVK